MKLASQVQHLEHYLSASKPLLPGEDPAVLHPSYMSDYGFNGVDEVLNLCSAVGPLRPLFSYYQTADASKTDRKNGI